MGIDTAAVAVLVFDSHGDPVAEGIEISKESKPVLVAENWSINIE